MNLQSKTFKSREALTAWVNSNILLMTAVVSITPSHTGSGYTLWYWADARG